MRASLTKRINPIRKNHIALAAGLSLVILYSGWWWVTARRLTAQIDGWIAQEQAKGGKASPETVSVGGYPVVFSLKLNGVSLTWPSGFGFTSQKLRVRAYPWALRHLRIAATGGFAFNFPAGETRPALTLAGETLRGDSLFYDNAVPISFNLTADSVSASQSTVQGDAGRELSIATVELKGSRPETPPSTDTDIAFDLSLRLLDLSAQALETNPLGATIAETAIHAKLLGQQPEKYDATGLAAWRDSGGSVEATDIGIRWGALGLTGNGALALDKDMQPEGAFTAHLTGFEPAIDALAAAGWIKMSAASLAKIALGIAAHPGADGKPVVDTPITIQNRRISLGPLKLGQMPELKLD